MAGTFNQLLIAEGIDPAEVSLLRHQTDKGAPGRTPYTLWRDNLPAFELYQSTQKNRPVFRQARYWAAFVSPTKFETLFVGLYEIELDPDGVIDWIDPLTERAVGDGKDEAYDLFRYRLSDKLSKEIGRLRIDWDIRAIRSWAQYAGRQDKNIVALPVLPLPSPGSEEGRKYWAIQRKVERDRGLRAEALRLNLARFGRPTCEACGFATSDEGLLDAHHPLPLRMGIRQTRAEELEILCPLCHRYAHRANLFQPRSIAELKSWVQMGRP